MHRNHYVLLKNIFDAGSIQADSVVESRKLLDELIEAGLVEVLDPGSTPGVQTFYGEYRLTVQGRALAERLPPEPGGAA